ncbi:MAG: hypothetical protein JNL01_12950 [Bdellovibrionales bacterium]|nr:hypothetical protein [Bdellovibrionales bacterium]
MISILLTLLATTSAEAQVPGFSLTLAVKGKVFYKLTENRSLSKSEVLDMGLDAKKTYSWPKFYESSESDVTINGLAMGRQPVESDTTHAFGFDPSSPSSFDIIDTHEIDPTQALQKMPVGKNDITWDAKKNLVAAKLDQGLRNSGALGSMLGISLTTRGSTSVSEQLQINQYTCKTESSATTLVCDVDLVIHAEMNLDDEDESENDDEDSDWDRS